MMAKDTSLPKDITSYDLLKTLAVILMIVDHVGHYFYPDVVGLRVMGRLSVPIWFFLIGYATAREVPKSWLIGGAVLTISSVVSGQFIFPLSILFTLAIARLWVDGVVMRSLRGLEALAGMFFLLFIASVPSMGIVEYGTIGLLFTMIGAFRRHKDDLQLRNSVLISFIAASILAYMVMQISVLQAMTWSQGGGFLAGMILVCGIFFVFEPRTYPRFTSLAGPVAPIISFMGRWTLEIYVVHLLFFRGLAMWLSPERFDFMSFQVFPPGFISLFNLQ